MLLFMVNISANQADKMIQTKNMEMEIKNGS